METDDGKKKKTMYYEQVFHRIGLNRSERKRMKATGRRRPRP